MTLSTCKGCPRRWSGLKIAHCACCHQTFSTPANFDAHKPKRKPNGTPACGKPAEMTRTLQDGRVVPVFRPIDGPHGVTWVSWREEAPEGEDHTGPQNTLGNLAVPLTSAEEAELDELVAVPFTRGWIKRPANATNVLVTPDGTVAWTESHVWETTNPWDPSERSAAQRVFEAGTTAGVTWETTNAPGGLTRALLVYDGDADVTGRPVTVVACFGETVLVRLDGDDEPFSADVSELRPLPCPHCSDMVGPGCPCAAHAATLAAMTPEQRAAETVTMDAHANGGAEL